MRRSDLVPECGSCAAVCCVATSFEASDDFAFDKPAGVACGHLTRDCRCAIHDELIARGCAGCAVYECYGAGPRVTRAFADLRTRDAAFLVVRAVHELLWLLTEGAKLCPPSHADLAAELAREIDALDAIAGALAPAILDLDLRPHHATAHALLRRVGTALGGRGRAAITSRSRSLPLARARRLA